MGSGRIPGCGGGDEVDKLLQVAQDELMLELSVDSHMSHVSPNYLDSDLDRRFQALRSRPSSASTTARDPPPHQSQLQPDSSRPPAIVNLSVDGESKSLLGDDLAARFAALKASLASPPSSQSVPCDVGDDGDEEDEVEKLIQWAKDAARLDPSPPSEEDEDSTSDEDIDDRRKDRQEKKKDMIVKPA